MPFGCRDAVCGGVTGRVAVSCVSEYHRKRLETPRTRRAAVVVAGFARREEFWIK